MTIFLDAAGAALLVGAAAHLVLMPWLWQVARLTGPVSEGEMRRLAARHPVLPYLVVLVGALGLGLIAVLALAAARPEPPLAALVGAGASGGVLLLHGVTSRQESGPLARVASAGSLAVGAALVVGAAAGLG